jgi:hypothetical protein
MGLISAVRSQMPVTGALPQQPAPQATAVGSALVKGVKPVAETQLPRSVYAPEPKAPANHHLAMPPPDEGDTALGEAEAARRAYIRASIVAGVSPLPLPGA